MNIVTRVKNGKITLPKELRKTWENNHVWIKSYPDKIAIEGPLPKQKVDLRQWRKAAGILKNRKMMDPVKWQRKIRKEWEHRLT